MLEGVNSEDKETVTTVKGVIKAVLDGVKVRRGRRQPLCWASVTQDLVPERNTLEQMSSSVSGVRVLFCPTAIYFSLVQTALTAIEAFGVLVSIAGKASRSFQPLLST